MSDEPTLPSLPAGYSSRWLDRKLEIVHRWNRRWASIWLTIAAVPSALLLWLAAIGAWPALIYSIYVLPFWLLGAAQLVNETRFEVESGGLRLVHGPFPLHRGGSFPRSEIAGLLVRDCGTPRSPSWYLGVQLRSGRTVWMVEGFAERAEAERTRAVLAEQLGVPLDEPVPSRDDEPVPSGPAPDPVLS